MSAAIIAIGIPGSGKTTLLKPLAERHGWIYINKDDIRQELFSDAAFQGRNKEVWEEANRRIQKGLAAGQVVVLDSTNVEAWKRREATVFAREAGATAVYGLITDVSIEVAKERNLGRMRQVLDSVIEWMHERLMETPPSLRDGFDELFFASEVDRLENVVISNI